MRIGIVGGSFNPAHAGHIHISKIALKSLKLDAIWWLITPKNPLKSSKNLLSMEKRIEYARSLLNNHPKIVVSDMEKAFGTKNSHKSIEKLNKYYPNTEFAFITGIDNAYNFHLWRNWKALLGEICMVHIARNTNQGLVRNCPARMLNSQKHVVLGGAGKLPLDANTTYWLLKNNILDISSTKIREFALIKDQNTI